MASGHEAYKAAKVKGIDTRHKFPIFVTANISPEVIEDCLNVGLAEHDGDPDARDVPSLMMTTAFEDLLKPFSMSEVRPFLNRGSPFLGWTPLEVHKFFALNCRGIDVGPDNPSEGKTMKFDPFPEGTFAILDENSSADASSPFYRTALLCANTPDFHEGAIVYLKTTRVLFEDLMSHVTTVETLTGCVSEIGKETYLQVQPPAMFVGGVSRRRQVISFDLENDAPWTQEHLGRQPGDKGFETFRITPED